MKTIPRAAYASHTHIIRRSYAVIRAIQETVNG